MPAIEVRLLDGLGLAAEDELDTGIFGNGTGTGTTVTCPEESVEVLLETRLDPVAAWGVVYLIVEETFDDLAIEMIEADGTRCVTVVTEVAADTERISDAEDTSDACLVGAGMITGVIGFSVSRAVG